MHNDNEPRKAGEYTIFQSLHIGDREVVLGENPAAQDGQQYMCAFCTANGLFALHSEVLTSDSCPEIVELYGQRIAQQAQKTRTELDAVKAQGISNTTLTAKDCTPLSYDDDLTDRIIIIKPEILRREYRTATRQIRLCTGGFGATPHSRGSACFCVDLYSGGESRFERRDILGILEPEQLPPWAKDGLEKYRQERQTTADRLQRKECAR